MFKIGDKIKRVGAVGPAAADFGMIQGSVYTVRDVGHLWLSVEELQPYATFEPKLFELVTPKKELYIGGKVSSKFWTGNTEYVITEVLPDNRIKLARMPDGKDMGGFAWQYNHWLLDGEKLTPPGEPIPVDVPKKKLRVYNA